MIRGNKSGKNQLLVFIPIFFISLLIGVFLLPSCVGPEDKSFMEKHLIPDTVMINSKIIQVDAEDSVAEAIAIRDGKIMAVGSNKKKSF